MRSSDEGMPCSVSHEAVGDRILRRVVELMPDRSYIAALQSRRDERFAAQLAQAANDAATLAPWLEQGAA